MNAIRIKQALQCSFTQEHFTHILKFSTSTGVKTIPHSQPIPFTVLCPTPLSQPLSLSCKTPILTSFLVAFYLPPILPLSPPNPTPYSRSHLSSQPHPARSLLHPTPYLTPHHYLLYSLPSTPLPCLLPACPSLPHYVPLPRLPLPYLCLCPTVPHFLPYPYFSQHRPAPCPTLPCPHPTPFTTQRTTSWMAKFLPLTTLIPTHLACSRSSPTPLPTFLLPVPNFATNLASPHPTSRPNPCHVNYLTQLLTSSTPRPPPFPTPPTLPCSPPHHTSSTSPVSVFPRLLFLLCPNARPFPHPVPRPHPTLWPTPPRHAHCPTLLPTLRLASLPTLPYHTPSSDHSALFLALPHQAPSMPYSLAFFIMPRTYTCRAPYSSLHSVPMASFIASENLDNYQYPYLKL